MEMKYKVEGTVCITKCPYKKGNKIGSVSCTDCEYFVSVDSRKRKVTCKFKKGKK